MTDIHSAAAQHPPKPVVALSPSSYLLYRQCPRRWAFEKVLRIPTPPTGAAAAGTAVHLILERLMGHPPEDRTKQTARQLTVDLLETVREVTTGTATSDSEILSIGQDLARTDMSYAEFRTTVTEGVKGYFNITNANPQKVNVESNEKSVTTTLPTPIGPVPVRGIIDRVDILPSGHLRVIDYKNGKVPTYKGDDSYERQILFYAAMLQQHQGTAPTIGMLLYVRHSTVKRVDISPTSIDRLTEDVGTTWQSAQGHTPSLDHPPDPGPLCGWCPFVTHCEEGQKEVVWRAKQGRLRADAPARTSLGMRD